MTRWSYTAEHCFNQLEIIGVKLWMMPDGKLAHRAPAHIDMKRMLPVIRKFERGLIRILRGREKADLPQPSSESSTPVVPTSVQPVIDAIKTAFADVTTVSVVRIRAEIT